MFICTQVVGCFNLQLIVGGNSLLLTQSDFWSFLLCLNSGIIVGGSAVNPGFAITLGFPFQNEHAMLVTTETYALNQTWAEQVLRRLSLEHNPVLGI